MLGVAWKYWRWMLRASRNPAECPDEGLAGWCLVNKPTFRLPGAAAEDRWIALRTWRQLRSRLRQPLVTAPVAANDKGVVVFDNRQVTAKLRVDHAEYSTGQQVSLFIARDQLAVIPGARKMRDRFFLLLLLPVIAVWAFFSRRRTQVALLLTEMTEAAMLLRLLRLYHAREFYFYCPFEKDANALYLLLREQGVKVNKIPSPNLLAVHNSLLLSDVLTLTSPYQDDELEKFRKTLRVQSFQRWVPELFLGYADCYENHPAPAEGTIGFYSHATWLRKEEDHADAGAGDLEAEQELLPVLADTLRKNPALSCVVFLHPREKRLDEQRVRAFYDKIFGGVNYRFADRQTPGTRQFHAASIGVGAFSTILFERLFAGYKTIFYPVGVTGFPVEGSRLFAACAWNAAELDHLIREMTAKDDRSYFEETGLSRYTKEEWLKPQHRQ